MIRRGLLLFIAMVMASVPGYGQIIEILPESSTLHQLRSGKRSASKLALSFAEKSDDPSLSGLLVIPVDFSDARLPVGWDGWTKLSPLLQPNEGETLHHYFSVASGNNLDLRITLAPVVHLEGTRRDYSDRYLNGFTRTRALATESISAARDMGIVFRSLDMEGPDRIPGSEDDDGDLDGILILHAGQGQENDPVNGWVQPLQFFLEEPVVSEGVTASFYAVASIYSGLGVWAHETAHLLGLEDRYDPLLHGSNDSDVHSKGGLGRFSLMASGAWGTGTGQGCALPDAYSALQMGWQQPLLLPGYSQESILLTAAVSGGTCAKIWTEGSTSGKEFFLLETRDPIAAAPFDATISGQQLLIYHIDENVPDGGWLSTSPGQYHLRVHLIEADGGHGLRLGQDDGNAADLFPGSSENTNFGLITNPSSMGYNGPSHVSVNSITSMATGVEFGFGAATTNTINFTASFIKNASDWTLRVEPVAVGLPLDELVCTVQSLGADPHGSFADGLSSTEIVFTSTDGIQWTSEQQPIWIPDTSNLTGLTTVFGYTFFEPGSGWSQSQISREWVWENSQSTLDFANIWPGQWVVEHPNNNTLTTWHRWENSDFLTPENSPILACTGATYTSAENWDTTTYQNNAFTTLTSGPLGPEIAGVRIIHTAELEFLAPGLTADGAAIFWIGPGGDELPAHPLQPWTAKVSPSVGHPLMGIDTFGNSLLDVVDGSLKWRDDVFQVPTEVGPWRLCFKFASNPLWRYKGWFIAKIDPLSSVSDTDLFQSNCGTSSCENIIWNWPYPALENGHFQIEEKNVNTGVWATILEDVFDPLSSTLESLVYSIPATTILTNLIQKGRTRHSLRIVGSISSGDITSNAFVMYQDGGQKQNVFMAQPWPNPSINNVKLDLSIPEGSEGKLLIYDLAGRCVFSKNFPGGNQFFVWDGVGIDGQKLSAGTYVIKLDGPGFSELNKVVLIR